MVASTGSNPQRPRRLRRWLIGLAVAALLILLAAYAVALHWFTLQIGDGVEGSIRATPAVDDSRHRSE